MNKKVAILGLGWLGLPFAQHLINRGYTVKGSVSSIEKAGMLQKSGFDAYPVEISEKGVSGEIEALLRNIDYLIIMIPPGLRKNTGSDYVLKMAQLLEKVKNSTVQNLVLVSSSAVYADIQGKVCESDYPQPQTNKAKQLLQVEELFINCEGLNTTVVRFGGLFGGNRKPVRYLAGRKDLANGKAPVNLIHRVDCIGILTEVLKREAFGHTFNAVNPLHPLKATYYTKKAKELSLEPPTFAATLSEEIFKQIDSEKVKQLLEYEFKKPL